MFKIKGTLRTVEELIIYGRRNNGWSEVQERPWNEIFKTKGLSKHSVRNVTDCSRYTITHGIIHNRWKERRMKDKLLYTNNSRKGIGRRVN
jgi:hypothetical protein